MLISVSPKARDVAVHQITRSLSTRILKVGLARRTGSHSIQLTTDRDWAEVKRLARTQVDPQFLLHAPTFSICEYPSQLTCMEEAFQRCMRYPVDLAKDERSRGYSWERYLPKSSAQPTVQS